MERKALQGKELLVLGREGVRPLAGLSLFGGCSPFKSLEINEVV